MNDNLGASNKIIQDDVRNMDQSEMDTGPTENSAEVHMTRQRKKKRNSKAKINVEVQREVDTGSTENLAEGNVTIEKPRIRENVQSIGLTKMGIGSTEVHADGNVIIKNPKVRNDIQHMDQTETDTGPTEISAEVHVSRKRKKKRKREPKINVEVQREMDTGSTENLAEGNVTIEKPNIRENVQSIGLTKMGIGSTEVHANGNVIIKNPIVRNDIQHVDQTETDTGPTEISAEVHVSRKQKKKRKREPKINVEVQREVDTGSVENLAEGNVTIEKPKNREDVQSIGQTNMAIRLTEELAEENVMIIKNPKIQDDVQRMDQSEIGTGPTENSSEVRVTRKGKKKRKSKAKINVEIQRELNTRSTVTLAQGNVVNENLADGCVTIENPKIQDEAQSMGQTKMETGPAKNSAQGKKRKRKERQKRNKQIKDEVQSVVDTRPTVAMDFSSHNVKDAKDISPSPNTPIRRKLLVLDVNGLLADIIYKAANVRTPDTKILGRAVYKRPFCDDFLKFCFQNFDVGIWSSRSKQIIEPIVKFLLGDQKNKLLFCWDMDRATKTKFNTLENKHKPLVCKELSKIWENDDCNLPWKKEDYDESNTLLLDDSPYKALLNPLHTAIFPNSYQQDNEKDDSLGPGGDLRVYLEGLVTAENVQKYVEQHPFGQRPITEEHRSWKFYSKVLGQFSNAVKRTTSTPNPVEGKSSTPIPVEGKSSTPIPVEGKSSTPIPVEGKSLTPSPVKGRDVKRVKAQQSRPIKRKREKAKATFRWPV